MTDQPIPTQTTLIETQPATRALADLGEPPRITDTIGARSDAAPAPSAKSLAGMLDKLGQSFNDALNERDRAGNPKMRADGGWMLKRGNGARKAKGKAPAGAVAYVVPPSVPSGDAPPSSSATSSPGSFSSSPTPGQIGTVDGVMSPEAPMLTEADYEATAASATMGMFSVAQLLLGPAWKPEAMESDTWRNALRRLWFAYQLPRVGPLLEVLMLIPVTIAKRRDDAQTKRGWQRMKIWIGLAKPDPKPDAERAVA